MKISLHSIDSYDPQEVQLLLTSKLDGKIIGPLPESLLVLKMSFREHEPRVYQLTTSCATGGTTGDLSLAYLSNIKCLNQGTLASTNSMNNYCVNQLLSLC